MKNKRFITLAAKAGFNNAFLVGSGPIVEEYGHLVVKECLEQIQTMAEWREVEIPRNRQVITALRCVWTRIHSHFDPYAMKQEELDRKITELERESALELQRQIAAARVDMWKQIGEDDPKQEQSWRVTDKI